MEKGDREVLKLPEIGTNFASSKTTHFSIAENRVKGLSTYRPNLCSYFVRQKC